MGGMGADAIYTCIEWWGVPVGGSETGVVPSDGEYSGSFGGAAGGQAVERLAKSGVKEVKVRRETHHSTNTSMLDMQHERTKEEQLLYYSSG